MLGWIRELGRWERFTLLKLLTGELRLGVSQTLVVRALANAAALPPTTVAARLMGEWTPTADWYARLIAPASPSDRAGTGFESSSTPPIRSPSASPCPILHNS